MELLKWRYDSACKADDLERGLGDALDVKASIVFVAATFLAGVSKDLLVMENLPGLWRLIQVSVQLLNLLLLAASIVFVVLELWPREYILAAMPSKDEAWIKELQKEHGKNAKEPELFSEILKDKLGKIVERAEKNQKINQRKSDFLNRAFIAVGVPTLFNMANLLALAVRMLWPLAKHCFVAI